MSAVIASLLLISPTVVGLGRGGTINAIPRSGGLPAPHPYAVSPDGGTVVGQFAPGNPFIYRGGNTSRFRPTSSVEDLYAQAVSSGGSVIVGRAGRAYAYAKGAFILFPKLPEVEDSFAYGVSDDGSTVTGYAEGDEETRAFVWRPGNSPKFLPPVDLYQRLMPTGIDSKGVLVCGIASDGVETMPFQGTLAKTSLLSLPKGMNEGAANSIDGSGNIIVGLAHNERETRAVVWIARAPKLLPNVSPVSSETAVLAKSVSRDGSIIGGSAGEKAIVWLRTASGYQGTLLADWLRANNVAVSGWSLESITSVAATKNTWVVAGFGHLRGREAGYVVRVRR
jgi:probable HAF family extracellular repeat protein